MDNYLAKMDRMQAIFSKIDMPEEFTAELNAQIARLQDAKAKYGSVIKPELLK